METTLKFFRERFDHGESPTKLMNEMEQLYGIPALNDPTYNEANEDVIQLYREISNFRKFDR